MKDNYIFSLLGNPNCGKTAIFNLLTGLIKSLFQFISLVTRQNVFDL